MTGSTEGPRAAALALGLLAALPGQAAARDAEGCAALANHPLSGGAVTSARVVEAAEDGPYGATPAYCEVRATARPAISIEVRLPLGDAWTGGLYQTGCGGFCGILGRADASGQFTNAMGPGLAKGYATATSDSGHHGLSVVDASWAHENPQAERDWGWRSVPETNRVAAELMGAFYGDGAAADPAIFAGCSTGGRMAMRAALDGPEMFDGIIAGAPAMDYPGLVGTKMAYLIQANAGPDGGRLLSELDAALIGEAVLAQCDAADGAEDGAVADPAACQPDLSGLMCQGGEAEDGACLDEAEMAALEAWRAGPRDASGAQLYPGGVPVGSEAFWFLWLTGADGGAPLLDAFAANFLAHMAFPDDPGAGYDPMTFDLEADPARMSLAAGIYNADDPDISAFAEAGGRMVVYHGLADPLVTPQKTMDWHAAVGDAIGSEARDGAVSLHMIPGLDHCGILAGPAGVTQADLDPLGALEGWLADGTPPESLRVE